MRQDPRVPVQPDFSALEDMAARTVDEYRQDRVTRKEAREAEERERQEFLSAFRLAKTRVLTPALQRVASAASSFREPLIASPPGHDETLSLSLKPLANDEHNGDAAKLTITADFHARQVICIADPGAEGLAMWEISEITVEAVQVVAEKFLRKALGLS